MLPLLTRMKRMALDLLFPRWCLGCGREGDIICSSCYARLPQIEPPLCPQCGIPQPEGIPCPACENQDHAIDGIRSPFRFEGVMRQAVHQFKYKNLRAAAEPLAELLWSYLKDNPVEGDILVPVPLYGKRLRERGYNQSALLARELSRLSGLPLETNCLTRSRYSSPQAKAASAGERRQNVCGAFTCRNTNLKGKRVILIDDVATSGATLDACAAALKDGGAAFVWGLTLAREV